MRDERERRVGASSIWHNPLVPAPIRDNNTSLAATTDKNPVSCWKWGKEKGAKRSLIVTWIFNTSPVPPGQILSLLSCSVLSQYCRWYEDNHRWHCHWSGNISYLEIVENCFCSNSINCQHSPLILDIYFPDYKIIATWRKWRSGPGQFLKTPAT